MEKWTIRIAHKDDLEEIQQLVTACDVDEFGTREFEINIKETWEFIPFENTVVVESDKGIIGYGFVEEMGEGRLDSMGFVHPNFKGIGIGKILVEGLEERAKPYINKYQTNNVKFELNNIIPFTSNVAKELMQSMDYQFKRVYSQMSIDLEHAPSVFVPSYLEIRQCTSAEMEKAFYEVYIDAFQDSNSFYPKPFDEWIQDKKRVGYDQSLWFGAYNKNEIEGFIIGEEQDQKLWVSLLGTKQTARGKGIGSTLLQLMFQEAYKRGLKTVALTVDDYSMTKPNRLYVKHGMKSVFQLGMYEKVW